MNPIIQTIIQAKRRLLNWRGDGVHSPYAFDMIRNVIRIPHDYYAFSWLYQQKQIDEIRMQLGHHRLWTERKYLELIFRIIHHHKTKRVYFQAHQLSLVPNYIVATGYGKVQVDITEADTIIIEDTLPPDFVPSIRQQEQLCILLNTNNPDVLAWERKNREQLNPPIVFSIIGIEMWIWRKATTPGQYPVYY